MLLHSQTISYFNVQRTIWLKARSTLGVKSWAYRRNFCLFWTKFQNLPRTTLPAWNLQRKKFAFWDNFFRSWACTRVKIYFVELLKMQSARSRARRQVRLTEIIKWTQINSQIFGVFRKYSSSIPLELQFWFEIA